MWFYSYTSGFCENQVGHKIQFKALYVFVDYFLFCFIFAFEKKKGQTEAAVNLAGCCCISFQNNGIHKFTESENLGSF